MHSIIKLLWSFILFGFVASLEIYCTFKPHSNKGYCCKDATFTNVEDTTKTKLIGTHLKGYNSKDVKCLEAQDSTMKKIPLGLYKFFPNIESIKFNFPMLTSYNNDLVEFNESLKELIIKNSNIEALKRNAFALTPKLTNIRIKSKNMKYVDKEAFNGLKLQGIWIDVRCYESDDLKAYNPGQTLDLIRRVQESCNDSSIVTINPHDKDIKQDTNLSKYFLVSCVCIAFIALCLFIYGTKEKLIKFLQPNEVLQVTTDPESLPPSYSEIELWEKNLPLAFPSNLVNRV